MPESSPPAPSTDARTRACPAWSRLFYAPSLLLLLSAFVPLSRTLTSNDFDWPALLNELHGRPVAFGRDIVFTYGPWGFIWGGYHPKTFVITCALWTAVAVVVWWIMLRLAPAASGASPLREGLILIAMALPLGGDYNCAPDVRLLVLPVLLLLYHFFVQPRPMDIAQVALVAVIAFTGLIKFTSLVAGAGMILIVTVDQLMQRDRKPVMLLTWLGALGASWLLAGQRLADFPAYLRYSMELMAGYPDAMGLASSGEIWQVLGFLAAAMVLIVFLGWVAMRAMGRRAILFMAGTGFLLFIAYRSGYVRHDVHELTATMLLLAWAAAGCVAAWPHTQGFGQRGLRIACLGLALVVAAKSMWDWHRVAFPNYLAGNFVSLVEESAELARIAIGKPSTGFVQWEKEMVRIRQTVPLPPVSGTVDVFPRVVSAALAHGMEYRPRPTLQSYAAMTPTLAALNADALAGPQAPRNLFFSLERDNEHFVTIDDSRCWLEILARYRFEQAAGSNLHLIRRDKPRIIRLSLLNEISMAMGKRMELFPDAGETPAGFLWAQIEVDSTAMGWLWGQVHRPPPLYMRIWTWGGMTGAGRLVRTIAADGFLIGPAPIDQAALIEMLADSPDPAALARLMPQAIAIGTLDPASASWAFAPQVRVRLFKISFDDPG